MESIFLDLLDTTPSSPASSLKIGLAFGLVGFLLVAFFLMSILRKKTEDKALKKVLKKSRGGTIGYAIGFLLLIWLRMESVPFLSMRLWFFLTLLFFFGWIIWKVRLYILLRRRIHRAEFRRNREKGK